MASYLQISLSAQVPPLTTENSHFLRSGSQEAALVMIEWLCSIQLLSRKSHVSSKLMEHILCSQIRNYLDQHGILLPYQYEFRKISCKTHLLVTTHADLLERLDGREDVYIAILDFSKAFDIAPHKRLQRKLRLYGIEASMPWSRW